MKRIRRQCGSRKWADWIELHLLTARLAPANGQAVYAHAQETNPR